MSSGLTRSARERVGGRRWRLAAWSAGGWSLAAGLLLLGPGCATPRPAGRPAAAAARDPWQPLAAPALAPGATADHVRATLGDPSGIMRAADGAELWSFPAGRARWPEAAGSAVRVRLRDGRVTGVESAPPRS